MRLKNDAETGDVLREWRTPTLNAFLLLTAVAAMPVLGATLFFRAQRSDWTSFAVFSLVGLALLPLALLRRVDSRIRAWGFLLIGYAAALTNLARAGLAGGGPWYLLMLPVLALILIGLRAAIVTTLLSLVAAAGAAVLVDRGLLVALLDVPSGVRVPPWTSVATLVMILIVPMVLLVLFYRFQERTLRDERRARTELARTQALLAKANETLEQEVEERTKELAAATRQSQQAQQQREALLAEMRVVLDAIDYGILLLGPDLRARMANRALRELWRLPAQLIAQQPSLAQLIDYNYDKGLYEVPREHWKAYVDDRVEAARQGAIGPTLMHRGDGRILRFQSMVLPDGGRMLTYFDISELVRQNEYLSTLNDTTLGLIARRNLQELLEAIIARAAQILGTPNGFIYLLEAEGSELECKVGLGVLNGLVGARLPRGEGVAGTVWRNGQPLVIADYDAWPARSTQIARNLIGATAAVPLTAGGQFAGVIGVAQNFGSRRSVSQEELGMLTRFAQLASVALENVRLYNAAEREKSYFASLLRLSPAAVVVTDEAGAVESWNPAAEQLFGYGAADARGRKIDDLVASGDLQQEAALYTQQSLAGFALHAVTRRKRRDGTLVDVELATVPLKNESGAPGTLAVYHDITALKETEEALRQAKEAAEAATQAKSAFLATMSHEIRTPMNAIIGMCGLLLDTQLTADQHDFAETIRESSDALLTIINDILDFSKIEAGKMELERQPFDLQECVESALDLIKLKAAEKGLELACLVALDVPPAIAGDVTRLRQILVNLLSNAVKFTEHGEIVVSVMRQDVMRQGTDREPSTAGDASRVTASPVTYEECELHFSVRDTGIGIPPDRAGRLFQAFSQVDASTTRRYGGTGLGLAVSKRLSEMMGGTMWVESEGVPGKGSTFRFTIRAPEAAPMAARSYKGAVPPELRARRMLIVDDNATNRRVLSLQALGWGMEPEATGSPQEALAWLSEGMRFDLAVLDLKMPDLDGIDLAMAIRRLEDERLQTQAHLPLILLSSVGGDSKEIPAGLFATCLTKPVRAAALFDALMTVLTRQQAPGAGAAKVAGPAKISGPANVSARPDSEAAQRCPLRILLAEDNVVNQKLALRLLAQMGYRADLAASGLEALQALERQPYDVILMDVQMPEMDGLEATRQIRARWPGGLAQGGQGQGGLRPHIIAMTANAMQGDREMCLAAGMDDYVSKPIRVEELVKALQRCTPAAQDQARA